MGQQLPVFPPQLSGLTSTLPDTVLSHLFSQVRAARPALSPTVPPAQHPGHVAVPCPLCWVLWCHQTQPRPGDEVGEVLLACLLLDPGLSPS